MGNHELSTERHSRRDFGWLVVLMGLLYANLIVNRLLIALRCSGLFVDTFCENFSLRQLVIGCFLSFFVI